jgi:hypothetical protein
MIEELIELQRREMVDHGLSRRRPITAIGCVGRGAIENAVTPLAAEHLATFQLVQGVNQLKRVRTVVEEDPFQASQQFSAATNALDVNQVEQLTNFVRLRVTPRSRARATM